MPIYEYKCSCGRVLVALRSIKDRENPVDCDRCGGKAEFVISSPTVLLDTIRDVPWLRDFARTRPEARFGKKQIETRTEYKKYLKDNDLRPADGINLSEV